VTASYETAVISALPAGYAVLHLARRTLPFIALDLGSQAGLIGTLR
jgi:hypothetical protein